MPFCMHCGTKISDNAKFCPDCGEPVTVMDRELPSDKYGKIVVSRRSDFMTGGDDCSVVVDDGKPLNIFDGKELTIDVKAGMRTVHIISYGKEIQTFKVDVPANGAERISFSLSGKTASPQTRPLSDQSRPSIHSQTRCPNCGGDVSFQTVTESTKLGCGSFVGISLLAMLVIFLFSWMGGVIIFVVGIILITRNSNETVTYAVCQKCGHRFRSN